MTVFGKKLQPMEVSEMNEFLKLSKPQNPMESMQQMSPLMLQESPSGLRQQRLNYILNLLGGR